MKLFLALFFAVGIAHGAAIDSKYISDSFDTLFSAKSTTNLSEGTNLYFTNQRALDATASAYAATGHNHTGTYEPANSNIQSHIGSTSNPHSVTATQVGLGNVTNDAQITKGTLTAKGSIIAASAASTPAEVAVGTNGYVLMADSGETAGVKWAAVPSTVSGYKATLTLIAGDITAQYVDMAVECKSDTLHVGLAGLGYVIEGEDYSVSVVSNKSRISFINDLSSTGSTPLIAGDKLYVKCLQ